MITMQSVMDMFDMMDAFCFICNEEHLIIWKNRFAEKHSNALHILDKLEEVFPKQPEILKKFVEMIEKEGVFQAEISHFGRVYLVKAKGFTDESGRFFSWWNMQPKQEAEQLQLHHPAAKHMTALASEYRNGIFHINNALEPLFHSLEDSGNNKDIALINVISRQCLEMLKTTVNMNEYLKFSNQNNPMYPETISLEVLMTDFIQQVNFLIRTAGREIHFHSKGDLCFVQADQEKLILALLNILTNTLEFSNAETDIEITLNQNKQVAELIIQDAGDGISQEYLKQVTDAFFSYNPSTKQRKGLGLGLYVADQIISAHNGRLMILSKVNQGTAVTVRLPLSKHTGSGKFSSNGAMQAMVRNKMSVLYAFLCPSCGIDLF